MVEIKCAVALESLLFTFAKYIGRKNNMEDYGDYTAMVGYLIQQDIKAEKLSKEENNGK